MVLVRKIRFEDLDAVTKIEADIFHQPWKYSDFEDMVDKSDRGYVVIVLDGRVIGGAAYRNILGDVEITNVELEKEYRGNGYSHILIEEVIKEGKNSGGESFTLEVRKSNLAAIHLYESHGFVTEGVRKGFYDFPKEDALIMWNRNAN